MFADISQHVAFHSHTFTVDSSARTFGWSSWPGSISLWHWTVPWQQVTEKFSQERCLLIVHVASEPRNRTGAYWRFLCLVWWFLHFLRFSIYLKNDEKRWCAPSVSCPLHGSFHPNCHLHARSFAAAVSLSKTSEDSIVLFEFHMSRALHIAEEFHVYSTHFHKIFHP